MSTSERRLNTEPQHPNMSFQVPGRGPCEVCVTIEPSQDPERDGQRLLGLYEDPNVVTGFPFLHATVKSLHPRIYGTLYGLVGLFRLGRIRSSVMSRYRWSAISREALATHGRLHGSIDVRLNVPPAPCVHCHCPVRS